MFVQDVANHTVKATDVCTYDFRVGDKLSDLAVRHEHWAIYETIAGHVDVYVLCAPCALSSSFFCSVPGACARQRRTIGVERAERPHTKMSMVPESASLCAQLLASVGALQFSLQ